MSVCSIRACSCVCAYVLILECVFVRVHIQYVEVILPKPFRVFELLIVPEHEFPLACVAVGPPRSTKFALRFDTLNLSSGSYSSAVSTTGTSCINV